MTSRQRIGGAPISWGISEVDDWGVQLPVDRVLGEMAEVGYTATEIGPDGFLPPDPAGKASALAAHGLRAIGSFLPVVLHRDDTDPMPRVLRELDAFQATGADTLILAAVTGEQGYDVDKTPLTQQEWDRLLAHLDWITDVAAARGVTTSLHPHVGTVVETKDEVDYLLDGSTVPMCFDTGHLMIGGYDPVEFAQKHAARVGHVHLKDVAVAGMRRIQDGEISYFDCIAAEELYRPLGEGDVDIRAIVSSLVSAGYAGWYVLEQDKVLRGDAPPDGAGPVLDARSSVAALIAIFDGLGDD